MTEVEVHMSDEVSCTEFLSFVHFYISQLNTKSLNQSIFTSVTDVFVRCLSMDVT